MSTMFSSKSSGGGAVVPPRRGGMLRVLAGCESASVWCGSGVDAGQVELGRAADDEVAPRPDLGPHQQAEYVGGGPGVLDLDPAQRAVPRLHGGLRQLAGVHLAQALVALRFLPALA